MTALKTYFANGAESTLSSTLSAGATTLNITSTAAFPSVPFYVVVDPDVDASREVILVDSSKTATTLVISAASKRGQDGTTDIEHSAGAKVAFVPVAAHFTDMHDRIDGATSAYTPGGTDVAVVDGGTGASTPADARTNLGLVIGTDVQAYSAVLAGTTASFTVADETKLAAIEAAADVTDATNVAAAGAVMESDTTTAAMSFVVDEDDMVSDSATKVPTQQSVKAYVDTSLGGGPLSVIKTADESVTSSTALQSDDALTLAVATNTNYRFEAVIFYGSSTSANGLKLAFSVPSGITANVVATPWKDGTTTPPSLTVTTQTGAMFSTGMLFPGGGTNTTHCALVIRGTIRTGATAGNVTARWAQWTSDGAATIVRAGSSMTLTAVA